MTPFIIERAAYATGRTVEEITSPCRARPLAWIRFAVMAEMRQQGVSLPKIARRLNRHHTTIMSGLLQAEALRGNPGFEKIRSAIA